MLERVSGEPPRLLVGIKMGVATIENSMEVPQKTKTIVTTWSTIQLLGIYSEKILIKKDTCTQVFTEALFTIGEMEAT